MTTCISATISPYTMLPLSYRNNSHHLHGCKYWKCSHQFALAKCISVLEIDPSESSRICARMFQWETLQKLWQTTIPHFSSPLWLSYEHIAPKSADRKHRMKKYIHTMLRDSGECSARLPRAGQSKAWDWHPKSTLSRQLHFQMVMSVRFRTSDRPL